MKICHITIHRKYSSYSISDKGNLFVWNTFVYTNMLDANYVEFEIDVPGTLALPSNNRIGISI